MEMVAFLILFVFVGVAADMVHYMDEIDIDALANHKYGPPPETEKPFSQITEGLTKSNNDRCNGHIKFSTTNNRKLKER